jgi:CRISPR-associated protein Cmr2
VKYLLAISIGPVQEFIAAARRTADLYAGSQLLMEVTRTVATALERHGAQLIFPSEPNSSGANKILAEVASNPQDLVTSIKNEARAFLLGKWQKALSDFSHPDEVDKARGSAQIQDFLEIYAAWVGFEPSEYQTARKQVEHLLAGRKALRDFQQTPQDDAKILKSPLDASRASVIRDPRSLSDATANHKPLRLKPSEYLDAVSLLKRIFGVQESERVIDTRTMARRARNPDAVPSDRDFEDEDQITEPQPYYAILHADGDRMGALIETKTSPEEHRDFSSTLSSFADGVQEIVEKHHGFKIYSGGDDVLAFLPVNTAIKCAQELAQEFATRLPEASLSVGIAIVHYREPLSISLDYARAAEKAAKNKTAPKSEQGNRLAVALHTRGGTPITVVEPWNQPELKHLLELYQTQTVSRGVPYELKQLAREWHGTDLPLTALQAEACRIVDRKEGVKIEISTLNSVKALEIFADKLVLARFLSGLGDKDAS